MTTTESRWEQVTTLFESLMDVSVDVREQALGAHAVGDDWIVREVRSLLAANDAADGRFDQSAISRLSPGQVEALAPPDALLTVRRVGVYDVVRKIGEGGMGAVYEAMRADASYQQRVAIKTIARGAESSVVASRFRRERQILAELQHPNIAVLLDGGVTDAGTPYFVMEYVDGLPIDQWCRTNRATIAQRLDLMQQVCGAVQHAHQRLVVHRDLKPQNVLVSHDGVVKLLDFGIAKLVESGGDDPHHAARVTLDGLTPMTAAYASPEQLRGEPVSTAGDVYSLGVMLYELLAGVPPFATAGRNAVQLAEVVITQTPAIPSMACTDAASRECGESARGRLVRRLSGELDAIVMMAMRKEAARRYSSVEALGADIQRYLRGMPVAARADTFSYRLRRFVARNRWPVTLTGALAVVALASGVTIARQSTVARRESARTARVSEFLQAVLGAADVSSFGGMLPRLGPRASVGALLDSALSRVPAEFADDPAVRARLYLTIGSSLAVQSRMREAARVLDSAVALSRSAYGERSELFARANLEAGVAALHRNHIAQARDFAVQGQRTLAANGQGTGELYARALNQLSSVALVQHEYGPMAQYAREALALEQRRTAAPTLNKAVALNRLGSDALLHARDSEGDSLYDASLAMHLASGAMTSLDLFEVQGNRLSRSLIPSRTARADSIIAQWWIVLAVFGRDSREWGIIQAFRSSVALSRGDVTTAAALSDTAIHIIDSIPEVVTNARVLVHNTRAAVAIRREQWVHADSALRRVLDDLRETRTGVWYVQALMEHAMVLSHLRQFAEAQERITRAQQVMDSSDIRLPLMAQSLHAVRGVVFGRTGDFATMERAFAALPPEQSHWYRNYVKKLRGDDSVAVAREPRQR